MNKHFERYQAMMIKKTLENWPQNAPEQLRHMTLERVTEFLQEWFSMRGMPDAELTSELAVQAQITRQAWERAFQDFLNLGRALLKARAHHATDREFWKWLAANSPSLLGDKPRCQWAMEAAQEQN